MKHVCIIGLLIICVILGYDWYVKVETINSLIQERDKVKLVHIKDEEENRRLSNQNFILEVKNAFLMQQEQKYLLDLDRQDTEMKLLRSHLVMHRTQIQLMADYQKKLKYKLRSAYRLLQFVNGITSTLECNISPQGDIDWHQDDLYKWRNPELAMK